MSYNIGYGQNGIENVAQVIRDAHPDIVALQEVDATWSERSQFLDQAEFLSEELGMHLFYAPIYEIPDTIQIGRVRRFGLAFLSKYPFTEAINHSLSRLSTQDTISKAVEMPGFPQVSIQIGKHKITLFNTHLDFRSDPWVRELQVAEMLSVTAKIAGPKILVGDFNAQPNATALLPIFDAFVNAEHKEMSNLYTFPADNPTRQIDYITFTDHFTLDTVFVISTMASDHLPILTRLTLKMD
jgi:endonuclease/exonuclease/phosphatase family metal-dependent hydrolase